MHLDDYNCVLSASPLEETVVHMFLSCPFAQVCWASLDLVATQPIADARLTAQLPPRRRPCPDSRPRSGSREEEGVFFVLTPKYVFIITYKSISELELCQTVWWEVNSTVE